MNEETPARLDGLTSLRFFLASAVVIGHHAGRDISQYGSVATLINSMAPYAVSWFFVLSGFVLFYNYRALPAGRDRLNFIALRFARVWPVHIVTLVATIGIFYYAAHIAKTQPGYVGLTAAMLHTWLPDANLNGAFNGPSWSISDEWFFYLCFVGFVAPLRWVRFAAYCLPIAIGIAIASYNGCWTNPGGVDTTPYSLSCSSIVNTFPLLRITEFIGGVGACMVYLRLRPTMDRLPRAGVIGLQVLSLSGFVMVLYALRNPAALFTGLGPISGYFVARGLLVVAGTCLITAVLRAEGLARACAWPVVIFGGEVSYSMYMTHQLLMEYTMPTIHQWWFPVQFATVMAMTIGVSTVLFVLVERPARDFVRRRLKRAPRPARHVGTLSRNLVVSASPRAAPMA